MLSSKSWNVRYHNGKFYLYGTIMQIIIEYLSIKSESVRDRFTILSYTLLATTGAFPDKIPFHKGL